MILTTHIKEQGAGRRQWLYHREYNCGDKAFSYANTLAEKRAKAECYENYTVKVEEVVATGVCDKHQRCNCLGSPSRRAFKLVPKEAMR